MRICSFLPSATEMLFGLGLGEQVVAVSHECDYPAEARALPRVTTSLVDPAAMTSAEIDAVVARALSEGRPSYYIDQDVLVAARPDLVITQDLCLACAIGGSEVRRAAAQLDPPPRILTLEPHTVQDILDCLLTVGEEAAVPSRAANLVAELRARTVAVQTAVAGAARPRVLCLEWLDPPWIAGHWMPEVVALAGGSDVLGLAGEPSRRATWDEIAAGRAEVAIVMPCGFGVDRALEEVHVLNEVPQLSQIPAFANDCVNVVDASSYYSRSGPRVIDGIELMARILHPDLVAGDVSPQDGRRLHMRSAVGTHVQSTPIISH
jgi:iron complex transport system substrate-binding protein